MLLITVDPPRWGDRIFTLRKTHQAEGKSKDDADEGTVFVRRKARTARAGTSDIRMLEDRLLGGASARPPELSVRWEGEPTRVAPLGLTDDVRRAWLDSRRRHLLSSVRRREGLPVQSPIAAAFQHLSAVTASVLGEDRTPGEYRAEVEQYMSWSEEHFDELIVDRFARS